MNDFTTGESPTYQVSVLELAVIVLGAITLVGVALASLWTEATDNMLNPERAEATARSFVEYEIPGGSEGVLGMTIGAAKLAIVQSRREPPDIVLLVEKNPTDQRPYQRRWRDGQPVHADANLDVDREQASLSFRVASLLGVRVDFPATNSYRQIGNFCGDRVMVTVEEGQHTYDNDANVTVPAVRYVAKRTKDSVEWTATIMTYGKDARAKAKSVFQSIRCK
ncbi:MAG: hypothetical protein NZ772_12560 [Cyanobacteria bacterium]|nr:hypothetical protein [Cyanobacteriota bacterium]MDW8202215.1 hypothetical protein [Cyanobacteriota bacterium SKYGB_h_bin112]